MNLVCRKLGSRGWQEQWQVEWLRVVGEGQLGKRNWVGKLGYGGLGVGQKNKIE